MGNEKRKKMIFILSLSTFYISACRRGLEWVMSLGLFLSHLAESQELCLSSRWHGVLQKICLILTVQKKLFIYFLFFTCPRRAAFYHHKVHHALLRRTSSGAKCVWSNVSICCYRNCISSKNGVNSEYYVSLQKSFIQAFTKFLKLASRSRRKG